MFKVGDRIITKKRIPAGLDFIGLCRKDIKERLSEIGTVTRGIPSRSVMIRWDNENLNSNYWLSPDLIEKKLDEEKT